MLRRSVRMVVLMVLGSMVTSSPAPAEASHPELHPASNDRRFVVHLLNRLAFGPRPGEVESVVKQGWRKWVERQLTPDKIDDREVRDYLVANCPSLGMTLEQAFRNYQPDYRDKKPTPGEMKMRQRMRGAIKRELKQSVLYRAVNSKRQFMEVMAEFWRNHFNIDHNKGDVQYQANHYEQHVIRAHAFGYFEDMLMASAKHPAMLIYLDNVVSQKPLTDHEQKMVERFERKNYRYNPYLEGLQRQRGLNENYARELMELHTLGVDNGYTQRDVTELARVLTGWTVGWRQGRGGKTVYGFKFDPQVHDEGRESVLGARFRWADGVKAGETVIRGLARHPNTAMFISYKLCQYLVNDRPSKSLVKRVAGVFMKTHGHLPSVYREIIFSPEFADPANFGAKFKTPFEFTVSALRATHADLQNPLATLQSLAIQGQPIYSCVDPTGYRDQAEAWLDPGVLLYRWEFALRLARDGIPGVRIDEQLPGAMENLPMSEKIATLERQVLAGKVDPKMRDALARVHDDRMMLGMVLGSPTFQQQ